MEQEMLYYKFRVVFTLKMC